MDDRYPSKGDDWFELSTNDGKVKVLRVLEMMEHDSGACIYGALVSIDTKIFSQTMSSQSLMLGGILSRRIMVGFEQI
ncbi:hypothetical protein Tco_0907813 [Tanacetum coccineum]|uniref:Uncharacterized protein n=1 Tax=Tanacetum coccineum TaxID=301880 RepID=A0ABQ5CNM8_9ASTR